MKHILILFFFISCIAFRSDAQKNVTEDKTVTIEYQDVIYLLDGSIFIGKLENFKYGNDVVMTLTTGSKVTIPFNKVMRMEQMAVGEKNQFRMKRKRDFSFNSEGTYNTIGLTILSGSDLGFGFSYSIGHRFNQWFGLGGGIAIEDFELNDAGQVIPLFGEVRGFLTDKNISPYYNVRVGHGIALKNEDFQITGAKGGIMFSPEIGFRFGGRDVQFFMGAGIRFQDASYTREIPWLEDGKETEDVTYKRINFKFGIEF